MRIAVTILIVAGLFTSRVLVDPAPILVSPSRNPLQLLAAAGSAASSAGWKVEVKDQGTLRAVYERGRHVAEVQISVAPDAVSLNYVNSKDLAYSDEGGQREIHKTYLKWTDALMSALKKRFSSMCTDLSWLQNEPSMGSSYKSLASLSAFLAAPVKTRAVNSSSGESTGYVVREYLAYIPNGRIEDCGPVAAIFYKDNLVSLMRVRAEPAALAAYTDILRFLVDNKTLSFADAEFERVSQKIDTVTPLDQPRRDELLRFVEWQTERLAKRELAKQEYEYLLAQKEADVQERQGSIQMKEHELTLLQQQQYQQRASLDLQRQQLAAQRSLAIGQALANLGRSLSYRPASLQCSSYALGNSVQTSCH